ncbi:uncharacterized protein LOC124819344 isoform X1 [Hydra vulgaris]|uniref:uncharacterized protein LOC124819344 isoform X1 n=1 Tax=Hydra vulgaris TaxID=6087 RepID=UPI0001926916|nr:uncharacterized protein LOC124819344 [Hydra vulgaris]
MFTTLLLTTFFGYIVTLGYEAASCLDKNHFLHESKKEDISKIEQDIFELETDLLGLYKKKYDLKDLAASFYPLFPKFNTDYESNSENQLNHPRSIGGPPGVPWLESLLNTYNDYKRSKNTPAGFPWKKTVDIFNKNETPKKPILSPSKIDISQKLQSLNALLKDYEKKEAKTTDLVGEKIIGNILPEDDKISATEENLLDKLFKSIKESR